MQIVAVGQAFPEHHYDQDTLVAAFEEHWGGRLFNPDRLTRLHRNVRVGGRHLALPIESYPALRSFTEANDAYIRVGLDVGERAVRDALAIAGLAAEDVDHLFFVSVTGVATPSLDAGLANRLDFRPDLKRTPIFGLGCVAGAAGVARAADYLRAFPDQIAVLLSVELCSLTLQRGDLSIPNLIASGLFGDGAAAVVLLGADRDATRGRDTDGPLVPDGPGRPAGPRVIATRSVFYPDTEHLMGWKIGSDGFRVVLSADVPVVIGERIRRDVDAFLAGHGLCRDDIAVWVSHPGGPRILEAMEEALELPDEALARTWRSLAEIGNLSSASVLMVLRETMRESAPEPGAHGLLLAMGPGFCSELVLLRW
ncbi:MAG: 3-oxoacyl-[acyl-carrier-protein] synthase III C-terminal domain-containing protein [Gemmatimonadota bacterium]|nr:3-oxoacyl-[acyl-carrier-protein] synthase III C-terminal domain-containing protein [Gemmatimonadota bacterium]